MGGPTHILERADPAERRRRISSPSHFVLDTSPSLPNRSLPFLSSEEEEEEEDELI